MVTDNLFAVAQIFARPLQGQYTFWIFCRAKALKRFYALGPNPRLTRLARFSTRKNMAPSRTCTKKERNYPLFFVMCACLGSNQGPFEYQSNALPTELHAHYSSSFSDRTKQSFTHPHNEEDKTFSALRRFTIEALRASS
ncbi:MAG: hypothetical protein RJB39_32 [Candidatus Parcubacteria bacterium]